ncbi:MAG: A24 family peptidase, partial [Myxococcota bacterium]
MHIEPQDVVLLAGVAFASATDLRSTRIPNVLTFPMMAVGIGANLAAGDPWRGVLGVAAAFALHFPLFAAGIGRAGDAKLMMAVG